MYVDAMYESNKIRESQLADEQPHKFAFLRTQQ